MIAAKPLPSYLVRRYHGWKATEYEENQSWYRNLAEEGQHPRAMVISCCDSRVHVTAKFGADQGEFFVHRNIANLVPSFTDKGGNNCTAAAIEYAVTALKVSHLIVIGHSQCGGVKGCLDMCQGKAPQLEGGDSFIGNWLETLRPHYPQVENVAAGDAQERAFEKAGVVASLGNLITFPFVVEAVTAGTLSLHGLWHDIGSGSIECFDAESGEFSPI